MLSRGPAGKHSSMHWRRTQTHGLRRFRLFTVRLYPLISPSRLQARKAKEWGASVELIFGDMRRVVLPEKVDILVSELLGSFGDNELSPECLDGAMRYLKCKLPCIFVP